MNVIVATTADEAWSRGFQAITTGRVNIVPSRTGDTYELLHVAIEVTDPLQRWVISKRPALNPAFALAEIIWMLAGKDTAGVLNFWNSRLPKFAGTGTKYSGAYGHRLRSHFDIDQLERACDGLAANPASRQIALQFWDPRYDLPRENGRPRHADVPCNICSLLKVRDNKLEWTQIMRSNDIALGLPYNFIQFTTLQEIMAGWLGLAVGSYHHWSDSLHLYKSMAGELTNDDSIRLSLNSDSLTTDFSSSQALIRELYRRMVELTAPNLDHRDVEDMVELNSAPVSYQNILAILGAESARRRGRYDQAAEVASRCTNPQIQQAWSCWCRRVTKNR